MVVVGTCPTPSRFQDLLEGRLGAGAVDELHEHIDRCPACFSLLAELGRIEGDAAKSVDSAAATAEASLRPSRLLAEYRLERLLGRGAGGEVWAAHDTLLDREVAIKFPAGTASSAARARFRREARAVARLSHPNVVTVHRVGELGARPFLVSELVRGDSLDRLPRPMPWPRVRAIACGLARGLAAAHAAGIVHRDLKPANAILGAGGEVKLLDFGLARILDGPAEILGGLAANSPSLTATGAIVGTPLYLAPEAWRGEPPTYRMDVYSLGAVLYELCTGGPPHPGATLEEVRSAALARAPVPLGGVEPRFAAIVMRCLELDPAARFADGAELCRALEQLDASPQRVHRGIAVAAAAAVGIAAAALVLVLAAAWSGGHAAATSAASDVDASSLHCSADRWCWDANWIGVLSAIWGSAADDVWAGGARGVLRHWDGRAWTNVDSGVVANLGTIRGTARDDVWLTGNGGTLLHFDGARWSQVPSGTRNDLYAVWPVARDDVWVSGAAGIMLHWDGRGFVPVPVPSTAAIGGIAGTSSRDLWATGAGLVLHWDGATWTRFDIDTDVPLSVPYVAATDDVWIVGFHSVLRHWDGRSWSKVAVPDAVAADERDDFPFNCVDGTSGRDVWFGAKRGGFLHWDGARWARVMPPYPYQIYRVWAHTPADAWAVSDYGIATHWDGVAWDAPPPQAYVELRALWNGWAAGFRYDSPAPGQPLRGTVMRLERGRWRDVPIPEVGLLRAASGDGDEVWFAGDGGAILHGRGGAISIEATPTSAALRGLWAGGGEVWAVGDAGTVVRRTGGRWREIQAGTSATLHGVWGSSADNVLAVGDAGTILRWRGGGWGAVPSGTTARLRAVWGATADNAWAVGDAGTVLHWDGRAWAPVYGDIASTISAVHGSGKDDVWMVSDSDQGREGVLVHWNGRFWTRLDATPKAFLRAVWAVAPGNAWVAGNEGTFMELRPGS